MPATTPLPSALNSEDLGPLDLDLLEQLDDYIASYDFGLGVDQPVHHITYDFSSNVNIFTEADLELLAPLATCNATPAQWDIK